MRDALARPWVSGGDIGYRNTTWNDGRLGTRCLLGHPSGPSRYVPLGLVFPHFRTLRHLVCRYGAVFTGHFIASLKVVARAFSGKSEDPQGLIDEIVNLATVSRKEGLLALEKIKVSENFLEEGLRMLIDGSPAEVVKQTMSKNMRGIIERNTASEKVWRACGEAAPAFGMMGTVIGLVSMMANMDDPKAIGPAMALALLTTLYGVVFAQILFLPVADKLKYRSSSEKLRLTLCIDGIMAIQSGQNPRVIASVLSAYLIPPSGYPRPSRRQK